MPDPIKELLTRRVKEVIVKADLEKALRSGQKLNVKFGIDPTEPFLHLGHSVPLLKLKEFQKLGHKIILIIGDATATIGDPTGRFSPRKRLTKKVVQENMKTYKTQVGKILDLKKTKFAYNSKWFEKMKIDEFMQMVSTTTYPQIRKRREYQERIKRGGDMTVPEFIYPIMQGYDSVKVKANIEIGGLDQKFNLLLGRQIQKRFGQKEQDILLVSLLMGTNGKEKMSKTAGNHITLLESPKEMYSKVMSVPDGLISSYFELCTEIPMKEVKRFVREMKKDPMGVKKNLAHEITKMYHGEKKANEAQKEFEKVFEKREIPKTMSQIKIKEKQLPATKLLVKCKLAKSRSEARRLIEQGGVEVNGKRITDHELRITISNGMVIKVGKRRFVQIKK